MLLDRLPIQIIWHCLVTLYAENVLREPFAEELFKYGFLYLCGLLCNRAISENVYDVGQFFMVRTERYDDLCSKYVSLFTLVNLNRWL